MDFDSINDMWANDCKINRNDLTIETLNTASLHQKYLGMLMKCKGNLIRYQSQFASLRDLKTRYYNGELSKDELADNGMVQYQGLKPLKSDMQNKLDGDSDIIKMKLKIEYVEAMIYQLESILHSIKGRDWAIKNHIQWLQFQAGN